VDVAEVRIRETYNPGAVTKVVGLVDGREQVLWEGTEATAAAPREFVVRPAAKVTARSIVVYLETSRVPGWNEIDAVELIGKDGSHQWAQSATASSSFADRLPPPAGETLEPVLPVPVPARR
jgi:hypothetical protein